MRLPATGCQAPAQATAAIAAPAAAVQIVVFQFSFIISPRGRGRCEWALDASDNGVVPIIDQNGAVGFPIELPIKPMLAKLSRTIPEGDGWLFEPKWDGFRCIVSRHGDDIELTSRSERPFTRYFPELLPVLAAALPDHVVVDGEIVIPDSGGSGLDFDALLQRIHPAVSRINRLAAETPTVFVAFDLLALGDESWLGRPFSERRTKLIDVVQTGASVFITPASEDAAVANEWFTTFEGAGLDGVVAKRLDDEYQPDKRALIKVKHQRTADCALAGYRIHKDGEGVGSMLLGLFDDDGVMHHVGVAAAFTVKQRKELLAELAPLTENALDGHPWAEWAEFATTTRQPWVRGAVVRGPPKFPRGRPPPSPAAGCVPAAAGRDQSLERRQGPVLGAGARRTSRRGDVRAVGERSLPPRRHVRALAPRREPQSCRYDQLDVAAPVDFREFMDAGNWGRTVSDVATDLPHNGE